MKESEILYIAKQVWSLIENHGKYNFPKSHAVAYALYAYICMYLKVNYPEEFFTSWLNHVAKDKIDLVIEEAFKNDIDLIYPSINKSEDKFVLNEKQIIMPLTMIKNIGLAAYKTIFNVRSEYLFESFEDFINRTNFKGSKIDKRVVIGLIVCDCFKEITDFSNMVLIKQYFEYRKESIPSVFVDLGEIELLKIKSEYLGIDLIDYSDHYENLIRKNYGKVDSIFKLDKVPIESKLTFIGKISKIKEYTAKNGKMAFIDLRNSGKIINVIMFSDSWKKIDKKGNKPKINDIVILRGEKHHKKDKEPSLIITTEDFLDIIYR